MLPRKNLSESGSVIIIVIIQLRDIHAYLLSFLLKIASITVRWVPYCNFKNSSFILTALFLLFTASVFIIYMDEGLNSKARQLSTICIRAIRM